MIFPKVARAAALLAIFSFPLVSFSQNVELAALHDDKAVIASKEMALEPRVKRSRFAVETEEDTDDEEDEVTPTLTVHGYVSRHSVPNSSVDGMS